MVLEAACLGIPGALVGPVARTVLKHNPVPGSIVISEDAHEVRQFFERFNRLEAKYFLPDPKQLSSLNI